METNNIFDGAYSRIIEDEAWQRVSGDYPFSAEQLEQYKDRLDWHEVSGNRNISWTASMLEKFKRRLDWHELFYPFFEIHIPQHLCPLKLWTIVIKFNN